MPAQDPLPSQAQSQAHSQARSQAHSQGRLPAPSRGVAPATIRRRDGGGMPAAEPRRGGWPRPLPSALQLWAAQPWQAWAPATIRLRGGGRMVATPRREGAALWWRPRSEFCPRRRRLCKVNSAQLGRWPVPKQSTTCPRMASSGTVRPVRVWPAQAAVRRAKFAVSSRELVAQKPTKSPQMAEARTCPRKQQLAEQWARVAKLF
mmetsp:Transcript_49648/g.160510  ORF Transcript_49648/g.160510 Transcript_49648/m.160510 type:complete len:205 (+) Transcript_49648:695-1309(+)